MADTSLAHLVLPYPQRNGDSLFFPGSSAGPSAGSAVCGASLALSLLTKAPYLKLVKHRGSGDQGVTSYASQGVSVCVCLVHKAMRLYCVPCFLVPACPCVYQSKYKCLCVCMCLLVCTWVSSWYVCACVCVCYVQEMGSGISQLSQCDLEWRRRFRRI